MRIASLILVNYAIALILLVASSLLGYALMPYMPEASSIVKRLEQLAKELQTEGATAIFRHNLPLGLSMAIPFLGYGFFMLIISITGFVLGVYVFTARHTVEGLIYSILTSAFLPHGVLEILAYSIFASASLYMTKVILKRRFNVKSFMIYIALISISLALLYIAAHVEYYEVKILRTMH